ncbi:Uncharacterised protein [Vibrio cholerae]|nr:Uncharacterised protein [Vibrio cholerae]
MDFAVAVIKAAHGFDGFSGALAVVSLTCA